MFSKISQVAVSRAFSAPSVSASRYLRPTTPFLSSFFSTSTNSSPRTSPNSRTFQLITPTPRAFSTKAIPPTHEELPTLKQLKKELVRVLDEDASDLSVVPDEDISEYISDQQLRITLEKDANIKVTKQVDNYRISVEFSAQFDPDAEEKSRLHDEAIRLEREQNGEVSDEKKDEEDYKAPQHSFTIQIRTEKPSASPSFVQIECYADPSGQFAVESFVFDDPTQSSGEGDAPSTPVDGNSLFGKDEELAKLYFDDLNESSQDKILEWLESIGIDDTFAVFVQQYAQMVRAQKLVDKIKSFKGFLQQ